MKQLGSFCLVLHTHLPWVAHNGTWPVGEEWLHQAFTGSWRRVLRVLESLAEHGMTEVLTLGVTPVVAAMLDDPYCLREIHSWAGRWQLRAAEHAERPGGAEVAGFEHREAAACLADLESRWLTGGLSSVLRPLLDAGVVELLSGPATHPFQPLLTERFAAAQLRTGLVDGRLRFGAAPGGIWAPECGYAPGMEQLYAAHGVSHFVVDGPAVQDDTGFGRLVAGSEVVAFARDLELSNRIWSARTGYPSGSSYRDFHALDSETGFRTSRVTAPSVPASAKRPWDRRLASAAVLSDARDFVTAVVARLGQLRDRHGREALVVAAYDTELFGHWWYEGPEFLDAVLRMLAQSGVRLRTLRGAREAALVSGSVELPASSWGSGKDWRVWENDGVAELNDELATVQKRLFGLLDDRARAGSGPAGRRGRPIGGGGGPVGGGGGSVAGGRDVAADQLAREAFLLSASDWAFMITRDSAAQYARQRARSHAERFHALADAMQAERAGGDAVSSTRLAARLRETDGPFGHLDARIF